MQVFGITVTSDDFPGVSTFTNGYCLIEKIRRAVEKVFSPSCEYQDWIADRSITRAVTLLVPFVGNAAVRLYDLFCYYFPEKDSCIIKENQEKVPDNSAPKQDREAFLNGVKESLIGYFTCAQNKGLIWSLQGSLRNMTASEIQRVFGSLENPEYKKQFFRNFPNQIIHLDFSEESSVEDLELLGQVVQEDAKKGACLLQKVSIHTLCLRDGYLVNLFLEARLNAIDLAFGIKEKRAKIGQIYRDLSSFFEYKPESGSENPYHSVQISVRKTIESKQTEIDRADIGKQKKNKKRKSKKNSNDGSSSSVLISSSTLSSSSSTPGTSPVKLIPQIGRSGGSPSTNKTYIDKEAPKEGCDYSILLNLDNLQFPRLFSVLEEVAQKVIQEALSLKSREEKNPARTGFIDHLPFQMFCLSREEENKGNLINLFLKCRFTVIEKAETVEEALEELTRTEKALRGFLNENAFESQKNEEVKLQLQSIQSSVRTRIEKKKEELLIALKQANKLAEVD